MIEENWGQMTGLNDQWRTKKVKVENGNSLKCFLNWVLGTIQNFQEINVAMKKVKNEFPPLLCPST
jgi:hypothetical protein